MRLFVRDESDSSIPFSPASFGYKLLDEARSGLTSNQQILPKATATKLEKFDWGSVSGSNSLLKGVAELAGELLGNSMGNTRRVAVNVLAQIPSEIRSYSIECAGCEKVPHLWARRPENLTVLIELWTTAAAKTPSYDPSRLHSLLVDIVKNSHSNEVYRSVHDQATRALEQASNLCR